MTTNDVVDALLFAKLADGRVLQVCLTRENALQIVGVAGELTGTLNLNDEKTGLEWERPTAVPVKCRRNAVKEARAK